METCLDLNFSSFYFQIQITALCMCVSISATVALGCLFAPKVYIVLFQPHKNVRQHGVASAHNPSANRMRAMFGMGRQMNGNITSPSTYLLYPCLLIGNFNG